MNGKLLEVKNLADHPKYENFPYIKKSLLEKTEIEFYKALETALEDNFFILHQIGLNRLLKKADRVNDKDWNYNWFNKIKAKSVDFVICNKEDFSVLLIIELDGMTHYNYKKKDRDNFVNNTLTEAGYNVLRIENQNGYSPEKLKELLYKNFNFKNKEITDLKEEHKEPTNSTIETIPEKPEYYNISKKCTSPGCYGTMKIRTDKDSKKYWVCNEYNKCKTAVAIEEAEA